MREIERGGRVIPQENKNEEKLARSKVRLGVFPQQKPTKKKEEENELRLFILFYAGVLMLLLCIPPFEKDPTESKKLYIIDKTVSSFSFSLRLVKIFSSKSKPRRETFMAPKNFFFVR